MILYSIDTLFTVVKLLAVNVYVYISQLMALYHILAYLQLVLLFIYSLTQS